MKKISIVILHFNQVQDTLECLKSLQNISYGNLRISIIIIDNTAEQELKIEDFGKYAGRVVRSPENLGFSGGNNLGIQAALDEEADYVLLLNNDTKVDKLFLVNLVEIIESEEKIGIAVPKIYFYPGCEFHKDRYSKKDLGRVIWYAGGIMDWKNLIGCHRGVDEVDRGQYDKVQETDYASGCCFLVKKEVLDKVGFFDDRYFLYYEDSDFSQRVKRKGYKIMYCPKSYIWHKNAGSAGGSGSSLQDYYMSRNRLLFGMRYAQLRTKTALLLESIKILFKSRKWQMKGVLDFYLRKFGKGSYPI